MNIVQFFALLRHPLCPEPVPIATFSIARTIVTVGHLAILPHGYKTFPPEPNSRPIL